MPQNAAAQADEQLTSSSSQESSDQSSSSHQSTQDPRHLRRAHIMQQVFAYSFYDKAEQQHSYINEHNELSAIVPHLLEIDAQIQQFAPERPVAQINKVDLAILRTIMFEWKTSQTPKKVLIDEGIELAKEFGTDSSPRFVNGVLAQLLM